MALCVPASCGCAITSSSIDIDGDGSGSNPYVLTALGTHVCTSGTRPTGIQGLEIYETDTARTLVYDGTNWVIQSGQMPGCLAYASTVTQSVATATTTTGSLTTELYDLGGYHTSTNGFHTIPSGMAGDYVVSATIRWAANATGTRLTVVELASNGSITNPVIRGSSAPGDGTSSVASSVTQTVRLVAAATVTLRGFHTAGTSLNMIDLSLSVDMIRHIPSLT